MIPSLSNYNAAVKIVKKARNARLRRLSAVLYGLALLSFAVGAAFAFALPLLNR
jgi:hypothetical protein